MIYKRQVVTVTSTENQGRGARFDGTGQRSVRATITSPNVEWKGYRRLRSSIEMLVQVSICRVCVARQDVGSRMMRKAREDITCAAFRCEFVSLLSVHPATVPDTVWARVVERVGACVVRSNGGGSWPLRLRLQVCDSVYGFPDRKGATKVFSSRWKGREGERHFDRSLRRSWGVDCVDTGEIIGGART